MLTKPIASFYWLLILIPAVLFQTQHQVKAAYLNQLFNPQVDYVFGKTLTVRAQLEPDQAVEEVMVFVKATGQPEAVTRRALVSPNGTVSAEFDLLKTPIRGFSNVTYWFRLTLDNGEIYTSPSYQFTYVDNRYDWEILEADSFMVHWYLGEVAFAQEVANTAAAGLHQAQTFLPLTPSEIIHIYVYDSANEMQAAQSATQSWVAGHADPDLSVVLVSLPPGPEQPLEMERQIPHELMHVLLYQADAEAYQHLPVWLNEGLASITELYPNPDYFTILTEAYQQNDLFSIQSLCMAFPTSASESLLAYAQSASFTRYLFNQFGTSGLESLLAAYADGLDCERGAEQALGSSLTQLETQWRRITFNEDPQISAFQNLLPWMLVLILMTGIPILYSLWRIRKGVKK